MNIRTVGDAPFIETFRMIGVPGRIAPADEELIGTLAALATECEIILLQSSLAPHVPAELLEDLAKRARCLVLEVPGIGDPTPDGAALLQNIQTSLGATK